MSDDVCAQCGLNPHPTATPAAMKEAERYVAFVEANRPTIEAIKALIDEHITDNKPGAPDDVYEWPESEAVVIVQKWADLVEIMGSAS